MKNFKLSTVYEQLVQKVPENAHQAEADVQMMLECALVVGEEFINWSNKNAILFSQTKKIKAIKN